MLKKAITFSINLFLQGSISLLAQKEYRGRYQSGDEEIGLPPLDLTGIALIIAIVLFAIGWIISKTNKRLNDKSGSTIGGCLIMLSIVCALPFLFWLQTIIASVYILGLIGLIIIGILALFWNNYKRN